MKCYIHLYDIFNSNDYIEDNLRKFFFPEQEQLGVC